MSHDHNSSPKDEISDEALKRQLISGYEQFAADYAASAEMRKEAEAWLDQPMEDKLRTHPGF